LNHKKEALGVDIGGVIIDRANDGTDTSFFSSNYLETTAVQDVFSAIRRLVEERFGDQVFLVSKCGQSVQEKTIDWLNHHRFFHQTGVVRHHVRFCRQRVEKALICQRLGITHFVDDRLEVLGHLTPLVSKLYLFQPRPGEVRRFPQALSQVRQVNSWQEILDRELS
jgi:hypothetical protein